MRMVARFVLLLTLSLSFVQHVGAASPPEAQTLAEGAYPANSKQNKPREHRNPEDYVKLFDAKKVGEYGKEIKRHAVICVPNSKVEAARATTLLAADQILNAKQELSVKERAEKVDEGGKRWSSRLTLEFLVARANSGGGKVLFLIIDVNDDTNSEILKRLSVSRKIKKPILRGVQFPKDKDIEIFKPRGRYKFSAKALNDLVVGLRRHTLKRVLTSEAAPADEKDSSTVRVTGKSLRRVVKNPARDVVLFLYNDITQRDTFMKTYQRVAKDAAAREADLTFAYIDVSRNGQDVIEAKVTDYPLVVMFAARAKPNDEPPKLEILDDEEELRYFIDRHRWYKDMAKLTPENSGFAVWEEQVVSLDATVFQDWVSRFKKFMAMFYIKKSSQSRGFRAYFGKALTSLGGPKVIPFVKIDCLKQAKVQQESGAPVTQEINRKLCAMHDVTGVPTLVYFDVSDYKGDVEKYNSTWTTLPYEQVTLRGLQKFLWEKIKTTHAEL